jgi:hypothetical protein
VIGAVVNVLRRAGKVAAGGLPAALVTGLGLPALGALVLLFVAMLGVACWVIGSEDRTARASRVLLAWRGNASCLAPGRGASPSPTPERRPALPRRS